MFSVHCSAKDEQFHGRVTLNQFGHFCTASRYTLCGSYGPLPPPTITGTNSRRSASHPKRNSPPIVGTSFPRCIQQPERPQVSALQLTPQGKRLGSSSEAIDFRAKFRDSPRQFSAHLFILTCIRSTIYLALLILDFMGTICRLHHTGNPKFQQLLA